MADDKLGDILSGKTSLPPTPAEIEAYLYTTLCDPTCMKNPRLALGRKELLAMVEKLSPEERKTLTRYAGFFRLYMEPLFLFTQDKRGKAWGVFESIVRSNLALHVMFSIVEDRTKLKGQKGFVPYLEEEFARIKDKKDIGVLAEEHAAKYPKNARRAKSFYAKFLNEKERNDVVKDYKSKEQKEGGKKFTSIEEVIGDIYGSMRSAFSHSLGIEHLWHDNYKLVFAGEHEGGSLIQVHADLSIDRFLALSWLAVLRSFGYPL